MGRSVPLYEIAGSADTLTTSPTVLFPYTDLTLQAYHWVLWVINDGPNVVNVQFSVSYDGSVPDKDTLDVVQIPPGQAASEERINEMRRYWSIMAWTQSGTSSVRFGVTADRETHRRS